MKNQDVIEQLRAANPATDSDVSRTDRRALDALRGGITMTSTARPHQPSTSSRRLRRGLATSVVLLILGAGGTAAYAGLVARTTDAELNCDHRAEGMFITGDAINDCESILKAQGLPTIHDPVAVRDPAGHITVLPRSAVSGATTPPAPGPEQDPKAIELNASLGDLVDGLRSRCFDEAAATAFVKADLNRLGLTGWTLRVDHSLTKADATSAHSPCTTATTKPIGKQVLVLPFRTPDPSTSNAAPTGPLNDVIRTLRATIASHCLTLPEAESVARSAVRRAAVPVEIGSTSDPAAKCTRVDMVVGGGATIAMHGPRR